MSMSSSFSWIGAPTAKEHRRKDDMLGLFVSMLDVRLMSIESRVGQDQWSQAILQELKSGISRLRSPDIGTQAISSASAWNEAYRLERLLTVIEPVETLAFDINRRLSEAAELRLPSAGRLKADYDTALKAAYDTNKQPAELNAGGCEILRSVLIDIMEELHWRDQRVFY
jgi:hypothetical protein